MGLDGIATVDLPVMYDYSQLFILQPQQAVPTQYLHALLECLLF